MIILIIVKIVKIVIIRIEIIILFLYTLNRNFKTLTMLIIMNIKQTMILIIDMKIIFHYIEHLQNFKTSVEQTTLFQNRIVLRWVRSDKH